MQKDYILITGASEGIGKETAILLAKKGFPLILVARNLNALENLKLALKKYQNNIITIATDLSNPLGASSLITEIKNKKLVLSALINNAGIGYFGKIENQTNIETLIHLNILSLTNLCKLSIPLLTSEPKVILNIASDIAFHPAPYLAVYAASKAYVKSFSQALHEELKDLQISVKTLFPGATQTNFGVKAGFKTDVNSKPSGILALDVANEAVNLIFNSGEVESIVDKNTQAQVERMLKNSEREQATIIGNALKPKLNN